MHNKMHVVSYTDIYIYIYTLHEVAYLCSSWTSTWLERDILFKTSSTELVVKA